MLDFGQGSWTKVRYRPEYGMFQTYNSGVWPNYGTYQTCNGVVELQHSEQRHEAFWRHPGVFQI